MSAVEDIPLQLLAPDTNDASGTVTESSSRVSRRSSTPPLPPRISEAVTQVVHVNRANPVNATSNPSFYRRFCTWITSNPVLVSFGLLLALAGLLTSYYTTKTSNVLAAAADDLAKITRDIRLLLGSFSMHLFSV